MFRRDRLEAIGARFGASGHGELRVTWPALLDGAADRRLAGARATSGAARPTRRRSRARRSTSSPRPTPSSPSSTRILSCRRHARGSWRPLCCASSCAPARTSPAARRAEFFAAMSAAQRRHRRGGRARAARPRRPPAAAAHRARRPPRASACSRRRWQRRRGAGRAGARRRRLRGARWPAPRPAVAPLLPRAPARPDRPDLAVFAAYWYRGYSCNPRAIYEAARELVPAMRGVWVVKRDAVASLPPGVEHVVAGTARVLRRDRPRALLRQQRQLPQPRRQAPRAPCT